MSNFTEFEFKGKKFMVDDDLKADFIGGEGPIMYKHLQAKEGDVFFDVGASGAMWTLYGLSLGAHVYSFEPSDPKFERLENYVKVNYVKVNASEKCDLLKCALGSFETVMTLERWASLHGGYGEVTPDCLIPFRVRTIDSFLAELSRLDWIKIDVEGGEYEVLLGGFKCLRKYKPSLIIENHLGVDWIGPWMKANKIYEKIIELLRKLNYTIFEEPHQGRGFIICR